MNAKQRFLANKALAGRHNELVASGEFNAAADAAMLHFISRLPLAGDVQSAAANGNRIEGAMLFLSALTNIGQPNELAAVDTGDNLKRLP